MPYRPANLTTLVGTLRRFCGEDDNYSDWLQTAQLTIFAQESTLKPTLNKTSSQPISQQTESLQYTEEINMSSARPFYYNTGLFYLCAEGDIKPKFPWQPATILIIHQYL